MTKRRTKKTKRQKPTPLLKFLLQLKRQDDAVSAEQPAEDKNFFLQVVSSCELAYLNQFKSKIDKADNGAVSALRIRRPKLTVINLWFCASSISSLAKPPSGPINRLI